MIRLAICISCVIHKPVCLSRIRELRHYPGGLNINHICEVQV